MGIRMSIRTFLCIQPLGELLQRHEAAKVAVARNSAGSRIGVIQAGYFVFVATQGPLDGVPNKGRHLVAFQIAVKIQSDRWTYLNTIIFVRAKSAQQRAAGDLGDQQQDFL